MFNVSVVSQLNSFTAIRRSQAPACIKHLDNVNHSAGAIFISPVARSFWGLGKNTGRDVKQHVGKVVKTLHRGSRKARMLSGWRLIPDSGQEIDQGRHGQRNCLAVTTSANVGNFVRDMEYLLRPSELSSVKAFPSGSLCVG